MIDLKTQGSSTCSYLSRITPMRKCKSIGLISTFSTNEFYKNKMKHQSHAHVPPDSIASQDSFAMFGNVENMTNEDKRALVNNKLQYMQLNAPGTAPTAVLNLGQYELALKRRHGAKRQIAQRQNKLRAMCAPTLANEFY